jgi:hypothetical protein
MESKIKHLEFIQSTINRMSNNSFLIKGWGITLVSALFALAASQSDNTFIFITYLSIPVFWILDGFYISQERKYRSLYNEVRTKPESSIDFNMDANGMNEFKNSWISCIFSKTLLVFYPTFIIITIIIISIVF